ncbi:DUF4349 domain-containing protein [Rathayibacter sp. YIM 133350]|uniref:DUF4349 domain-containing protein n=1 Tax=Rathayibacter sp. YIM 133350 TaxID=3131992 RepID=UPI00307D57D5
MNRALTAATVAVASLLLLSGCSLGSSADSRAPSDAGGSAPQVAQDPEKAADGSASSTGSVQPQQVITTGSMTVTADDPVASGERAAAIVTDAGGRVESRSQSPQSEDRPASANLVLRIPADDFDAVVKRIGALGDVRDYTTQAADVTQQKKDVDARILALQTSVGRLEQLMGQAATTADLIEIENALSARQAELDSLIAQRDSIADQVAYSTLSASFTAPGVIAAGAPHSFWDGLVAGWQAVIAFLSGALVVIGVLLPWIGVLVVIAAIVLGIVWLARRGRGSGTPPVVE